MDFIVGDKELAIEIKGSKRVHEGDLGHLKRLSADGPVKKSIIVCLEDTPRLVDGKIEVLPWTDFIQRLWNNQFISS